MGFLGSIFGKRKRLDANEVIASPNGRVKATFVLTQGKISYHVKKDEKVILKNSALGMRFSEGEPLGEGLYLVRVHSRKVDEEWETVCGEERVIRNNYNETAFYLEESKDDKRLVTIRFRVFNDGVAFRYEFPPHMDYKKLTILDELTEFAVDFNGKAWNIPAYQPDRYEYNYERRPVYELKEAVHTPLTIETSSGHFVTIHEAALYDYGSMTVKMEGSALKSDITPLSDGVKAEVKLPFSTPWRVVIIAHNAIDLTVSRMVLNLNDPPTQDMSWVQPTKFMGIWWAMFVGEWTWASGGRHGATTEHAIEYIDACKRLKIPALLIEGWNDSWEGDWLENGVNNKFMEPYPDFDMAKVAAYAKKQGVDLVGHHETVGFVDNYEKQQPAAFEYMQKHGIRYVKGGYAGSMMTINNKREYHHSQLGVRHYQKMVELAAKYGIMLDIHEPIKSTGIERTWPNFLTREGARGQEYEGGALSPSHMCILPFTRLLAGGMDYTPGILDVTNFTKRLASTVARQLAYYVIIFSGMQMASDRPRIYEEHLDVFKFIQDVPVNWEKTVPILGEIGEYYVVARQGRGETNWYIGGVTNEDGRQVRLSLDFLGDGDYMAEIYKDSEDAHYRDHQMGIIIDERRVARSDELDVYMAPGGGFAVRLRKL